LTTGVAQTLVFAASTLVSMPGDEKSGLIGHGTHQPTDRGPNLPCHDPAYRFEVVLRFTKLFSLGELAYGTD